MDSNGSDPHGGWVVAVDNGLRLVGRQSISGALSPAYEMGQAMAMTPQGPQPIPVLLPPLQLPSLGKRMPLSPGALIIPFAELANDERQALEMLARRCDAEMTKAKAEAAGIVLSPTMPRKRP